MKISGFTFVRNGKSLGYPVAEAIKSVLPICDEFVIALGKGDEDDTTEQVIKEINDPKIKIIDTVWPSVEKASGARIYSDQTNIALNACTGDWCLYIQCDEIVHEKHLGTIVAACEAEQNNPKVEGFLFRYKHFWGDYDHYQVNHRNYPFEVRLIRNGIGATSIGDAQSFRIAPEMRKPRVIEIEAEMFHYGYVRHPYAMMRRTKAITANYHGTDAAQEMFKNSAPDFEYGSLEKIHRYNETYPAVLRETIAEMNWADLLTYNGPSKELQPHEKPKERIRDWVESNLFQRRQPWGYRCYKRLAVRKYTPANIENVPVSSRPAISLIIAVYKRPEALEMIFEALLRQSFTDFEVVIADDGSGEEIADLVKVWSDRLSIQHIWHEDEGFRKTIIINKAAVASRGEYLISIDGDCIPHHLFIQDHWERRQRKNVLAGRRVMLSQKATDALTIEDIRSGAFESPFRWIGSGAFRRTRQYAFRNTFIDPIRNKKRQDYFVLGSNFSLFRDDFINTLNGYDERIIGRGMEDNNLHARVMAAGMPIRSISQVALQYHLEHNADPIPHDAETVKKFCTVSAGWSDFGIVKSDIDTQ